VEIIALGLNHASAIADYVADFNNAGEQQIPGYFGKKEWSHAQTIEKLDAWSRGEDLGGWVRNTTRFLFENGRILGHYNFRHELTDALRVVGGNCGYGVRPSERRKGHATRLLADAKEFGRGLGLEQILVTCDQDNIGSARTIEKNGGVLQDLTPQDDCDALLARYWITL